MRLGLLLGITLPGTQPNELTEPLRPPSVCEPCHAGYADYDAHSTWEGTMMANAARDPLFHAALTVANQDVEGAGDLCIRCHSPRAWLFGRSEPSDGSAFEEEDFEGVQCDFCHRLTAGPDGEHLIGTGQYFVANDFVRRGPIADSVAPHEWEYSEYHQTSMLCGICHDVSNPLETDAYDGGFPIERTFTEWASSVFPAEGVVCQSCHMPAENGKACGARDMPNRIVHRHELAGGNSWMPRVLAGEHPELGRQAAYDRTVENALRQLASAAALRVDVQGSTQPGGTFPFVVRVENLTGHKLPTGYPEGRRCWLEVVVTDASGTELLHSGEYDFDAAERNEDPLLRTYEARMSDDGVEGFHFILQDELLQDNRIPPRGFVPSHDTRPVGRDYPVQPDGTLAFWDDAPYEVDLPAGLTGSLTVRATLWYQTTSREYVEFLRDENVTDDRGTRMFDLWEQYDRAEPVEMATASATVEIDPIWTPFGGGCTVRPLLGNSKGKDRNDDLATLAAGCWALCVLRGMQLRKRRR